MTVSDELELVRQELAATNALLVGLSAELSAARAETSVRVEGLRVEQHRERRVRMMYVGVGGVAGVWGYDSQVSHCSPGARVVHGIDYLIAHPVHPGESPDQRQGAFQQVYDSAPTWCEVVTPLHTHDGSHYPQPANAGGLAIVATIALAIGVYHRFRTRRDFAHVSRVIESEEQSRVRRA